MPYKDELKNRECKKRYKESHREEIRAAGRAYYTRNRDVFMERHKQWYQSHKAGYLADRRNKGKADRLKVLEHYGNRCACCSEMIPEFLAIDHINGRGSEHRKSLTSSIYHWLIKNNFPEGFRLLCHNCNMSLGLYGYCPHQKGDRDGKKETRD